MKVDHLINTIPEYASNADTEASMIERCANLLVDTIVDDFKAFVIDVVETEIADMMRNPNQQEHAREKKNALSDWKQNSQPFGGGLTALRNMLLMLAPPNNQAECPPLRRARTGEASVIAVVGEVESSLSKFIQGDEIRVKQSLTALPTGSFAQMAEAVWAYLRGRTSLAGAALFKRMKITLAQRFLHHKIVWLPWNNPPDDEHQNLLPRVDRWIKVTYSNIPGLRNEELEPELLTLSERRESQADNHAEAMAGESVHGVWLAYGTEPLQKLKARTLRAQVLPDDVNFATAVKVADARGAKVMRECIEALDVTKPRDHVVILVSIILTRLLPGVGLTSDEGMGKGSGTPYDYTRHIRQRQQFQIPKSSKGDKGLKDRSIWGSAFVAAYAFYRYGYHSLSDDARLRADIVGKFGTTHTLTTKDARTDATTPQEPRLSRPA